MSHDLRDNDAVVAVGGAVQAVDGLGGNAQRGIETDGRIGEGDIIINGFRERNDIQSLFLQAQ